LSTAPQPDRIADGVRAGDALELGGELVPRQRATVERLAYVGVDGLHLLKRDLVVAQPGGPEVGVAVARPGAQGGQDHRQLGGREQVQGLPQSPGLDQAAAHGDGAADVGGGQPRHTRGEGHFGARSDLRVDADEAVGDRHRVVAGLGEVLAA
jgi:hypothetical protein